jgi:ribonuclease P protein component
MDCVRHQGRRAPGRLCVAAALTPPPDGQARVAFVVSRRYSPKAVVRNRARRLLREAYRQVRPGLTSAWLVLIPRQRMQPVRMQDVLADLRSVCRQLGLLP